jgi:hypothetical protein
MSSDKNKKDKFDLMSVALLLSHKLRGRYAGITDDRGWKEYYKAKPLKLIVYIAYNWVKIWGLNIYVRI